MLLGAYNYTLDIFITLGHVQKGFSPCRGNASRVGGEPVELETGRILACVCMRKELVEPTGKCWIWNAGAGFRASLRGVPGEYRPALKPAPAPQIYQFLINFCILFILPCLLYSFHLPTPTTTARTNPRLYRGQREALATSERDA